MYYLKTEHSFDSAHFLAGYEGKCRNIHGHEWRVVIEICRPDLDEEGQTRDMICLLYTSDAADELDGVDLGGRRIIKKKFFQAEDGILDVAPSRGLGDVYKRQGKCRR